MRYLTFDLSEGEEGVTTIESMASTSAEQHPAVIAEVEQVLAWAWGRFPQTHGAMDDGNDWDHDLQVTVEDGPWHTVALTLTGSDGFVEAFLARFGRRVG
jgi:VCBS repeat-containing protein